MSKFICIHGHFYQPPRENPWLGKIPLQESAAPYHDWNERISDECYAPNTHARILNSKGEVVEFVNNYSMINFNFGPTLLSWLEKADQKTYRYILEADQISLKNFDGHGCAISQVYNHMIMPLANRRDKYTQAFWGLRDFEYRFKRFPEGMWLPETAVDIESLEVLAELGIKYTILAPRQAKMIRPVGQEQWDAVDEQSLNERKAYVCNLPSGKSISIFFYNGKISNEIAFGKVLKNGEKFFHHMVEKFINEEKDSQIISVATDGETYGHHHTFGEMGLAYFLKHVESEHVAQLTVFGKYLKEFPPQDEVLICENTSWSCSHGVSRWEDNCGCKLHVEVKSNQSWRKYLREAMNWLGDELSIIYQNEMVRYHKDPWHLRNHYIDVVLNPAAEAKDDYLKKHELFSFSAKDKIRIFNLLEMQRYAMLGFTSCGWFFDDISGIETIQIMQYAARAIEYAKTFEAGMLEDLFLNILEKAISNKEEMKNGRFIYEKFAKITVS